jgi:hypothetical protein
LTQHNNLQNFYKNNFDLKQLYNFSIQEIEALMPWERDVYIDLIKQKVEEDSNR